MPRAKPIIKRATGKRSVPATGMLRALAAGAERPGNVISAGYGSHMFMSGSPEMRRHVYHLARARFGDALGTEVEFTKMMEAVAGSTPKVTINQSSDAPGEARDRIPDSGPGISVPGSIAIGYDAVDGDAAMEPLDRARHILARHYGCRADQVHTPGVVILDGTVISPHGVAPGTVVMVATCCSPEPGTVTISGIVRLVKRSGPPA
ncbi:MAG: hypothetical protein M0R22_13060 [Dehalococcoidia bacterium]|jgi:hypothetical protein|nr:hypothetical protein [Dehalococcoidia bacterium]